MSHTLPPCRASVGAVDTTITIRLPEELADELRVRAEVEYRSVSNLVRLAVIQYLDTHATPAA